MILDVSSWAHLFGGEATIMAEVERSLAKSCHPARVALDGSPDATAAVARKGSRGGVVQAGRDAAALAELPIAALRLPGEVTAEQAQ